MRIPEIRDRLIELSGELGNPELAALANELTRRKAKKRAAPRSRPMTPALADEIRALARANPRAAQTTIARMANVNPGRVSEAINGKRK